MRDSSFLPITLLFVAMLVFELLLLKAYSLRLTKDEFIYHTLLGSRKVAVRDISHIEFATNMFRKASGAWQPPLLLRVTVSHQKPIEINARVFSKEDLNKLFALLVSLRPNLKTPRIPSVADILK